MDAAKSLLLAATAATAVIAYTYNSTEEKTAATIQNDLGNFLDLLRF